MRLFKYVKNSKVLGIILGIILSVTVLAFDKTITSNEDAKEGVTHSIKIMQDDPLTFDNNDYRYASNVKIKGKKMVVGATAYCGDTITSRGTVPIEGITIAVDPNVIPYGSKVYIPKFNRVFIAEDCGSAIKGNRIDIFMIDYNKCMDWGFRDIEIYILD